MGSCVLRRRYTEIFLILSVLLFSAGLAGQALAHEIHLLRPAGSLLAAAGEAVLREAYRELGIEIVVEAVPPDVGLGMSVRGDSDGEVYRPFDLSERSTNLVRVPTALAATTTVAVFSAGSGISVATIDDLAAYRVVRIAGMVQSEHLTEGLTNVQRVGSYDEVLRALTEGEADVGVVSWVDIRVAISEHGWEDDFDVSAPLGMSYLHHYLHERHAYLVPRIDAVLARMAATGMIAEIRASFEDDYFAAILHSRR